MELASAATVIMAGQGAMRQSSTYIDKLVNSVHPPLAEWAITFRKLDGLVMLFLKHSWPEDVIRGQHRGGLEADTGGRRKRRQQRVQRPRIPGAASKRPNAIGDTQTTPLLPIIS
jgi:hypothetical protein